MLLAHGKWEKAPPFHHPTTTPREAERGKLKPGPKAGAGPRAGPHAPKARSGFGEGVWERGLAGEKRGMGLFCDILLFLLCVNAGTFLPVFLKTQFVKHCFEICSPFFQLFRHVLFLPLRQVCSSLFASMILRYVCNCWVFRFCLFSVADCEAHVILLPYQGLDSCCQSVSIQGSKQVRALLPYEHATPFQLLMPSKWMGNRQARAPN